MSINEIIESEGRYLLLQRSYPEDDYERDYIYYEPGGEGFGGELIDGLKKEGID